MPQLLHGGPGRAGGGEELGATRGLGLYMQRVALQGDRALVEAIAGKR
jgi:oxepin-CoA hydrolase/3-oxo-5,6-dehydrosuberyl-CoA semialdehyde dehydrogenase